MQPLPPFPKRAGRTKHLLLIEDDPNTREGLANLLHQDGHDVVPVRYGREAFTVLANTAIDLVLCDYQLPDMDGLQLCRELHRSHPELALCIMTAYNHAEFVKAAQSCGVQKIFNKPLDVEALLAALRA
jgi:DNA-binding response OmpR family regulator